MKALAPAMATLALLAVSPMAIASTSPDGLRDFLHPDSQLSARDEAWVLYAHRCGIPLPDPLRAPEVTVEETRIVVDLFLFEPTIQNCFEAENLPPVYYHASIGKQAMGAYTVERRLWLRSEGSDERRLAHSDLAEITVGDTPAISLSGSWFNPEAPGSGTFISLLPKPPEDAKPRAVLYLAEVEPSGSPVWYTGVGEFEDGLLTLDLIAGGSGRGSMRLSFAYLRCGEGALFNPAFPTFFTPLVQLTAVAGVPACAPPGQPFPAPITE
ncbi:MAG: hypothetical protein MEQ07_03650 [Aquimonas sp.]|nr:hypothetical protein [Aquimonas sp.]